VLAIAATGCAACSSVDPDLLRPARRPGDGGPGERDAGRDGQAPRADDDGGAPTRCEPRCEECNGEDDDGDGTVDEGEAADACNLPSALSACIEGECALVRCDEGRRDCDGELDNGCEVAIDDLAHCGGCGQDCREAENATEASCGADLACRIVRCEEGFVDCDGDAENGCEASFTEVLNCGGCASAGEAEPCTGLPGVLASECGTGECRVSECLPGFADCNRRADDGCERDTAAEGCCPDEPDTDADGIFDCLDRCPHDPDKGDPGECGCGVSDADADGDGIADCRTDCWGLPSNFDPFDEALSFDVDANLSCSPTIDTSAPPDAMVSGWCNGEPPVPVVRDQPAGGPRVAIVPLRSLTLAAGETLRLIGELPVLLAVQGDALIDGHVDAGSSDSSRPGAGAGGPCGVGDGAPGADAVNDGAAGGGGGSFGSAGGRGGRSDDGNGGAAGAISDDPDLKPLRAGCRGGRGGDEGSGGGAGGLGGGALQVSVTGTLHVSDTGVVSASGGGGRAGTRRRTGGGGGGSGGAVLLEANLIELRPGSWVTVNGGSGAGGGESLGPCNGAGGRDGVATRSTPTPGGPGCSGSGDGGAGAASGGGATPGESTGGNDAAGGGGGGLGRLVMQPLAGSLCAR
jgi:hypothetical protein